MKSKETAIKEVYGEMWDKLSTQQQNYALKNNGTIFFDPSEKKVTPKLLRDLWDYFKKNGDKLDDQDYGYDSTSYHTPISLQGIEDNNGWIKIEKEEDLPKKESEYWVISNGQIETCIRQSGFIDNNNYWWLNNVTHYQPIKKPKKPLY